MKTINGLALTVAVALLSSQGVQAQVSKAAGYVFTEDNGTPNNVLVFARSVNGALSLAATVPTGGQGGGVVSVGSQGALAMSEDRRWLFVANEGDDSITVMEQTGGLLQARGTVPSGGTLPVSITVKGNLVYVLNDGVPAGGPTEAVPANITGFRFNPGRGTLDPIPNSTRTLSATNLTAPVAGPIAAEISFDNTGRLLFVAEVGTSLIDTYAIDDDGAPSQDRIQKSFGDSPFAFAFDPRRDYLLVAEVREPEGILGTGAVTSYQLDGCGDLFPISGSIADSNSAPCWVAIAPSGDYAYVINTASAVISGYKVGNNGELSLLDGGNSATTPAHPLDNAFTPNGRYMYVVTGTQIVGYQVESDGSLTSLNLGDAAALPSGSRGLIAE